VAKPAGGNSAIGRDHCGGIEGQKKANSLAAHNGLQFTAFGREEKKGAFEEAAAGGRVNLAWQRLGSKAGVRPFWLIVARDEWSRSEAYRIFPRVKSHIAQVPFLI